MDLCQGEAGGGVRQKMGWCRMKWSLMYSNRIFKCGK